MNSLTTCERCGVSTADPVDLVEPGSPAMERACRECAGVQIRAEASRRVFLKRLEGWLKAFLKRSRFKAGAHRFGYDVPQAPPRPAKSPQKPIKRSKIRRVMTPLCRVWAFGWKIRPAGEAACRA